MEKTCSSLSEIGKQLLAAKSVLLLPHIQMDGDAFGSAVAICKGLRSAGKEAWILIEDGISDQIKFLENGYCTDDQDKVLRPDVCMCVDCGDTGRFPKRAEKFAQGKTTICVDHHTTSVPFADYNYIDSNAAATAEIIFDILKEMCLEIDKEMGEALFAGICTDTGNFQYSNATKQTHLIVAELYDCGIDHNKVAVCLYQNTSLEKLQITNRVMSTMEILNEGNCAMAYVTKEMLTEVGATGQETEGIVETLRDIKGVEISAFLKEKNPGEIKVSLRAKTSGNVADISAKYKGGGHVKAAGFTLHMTMDNAKALVKNEISISLEKTND
ncbi:MAG: bifunctional oligoribonuclease/PAP phosphatase NrnA [Anaerovoracaceae bacterium]